MALYARWAIVAVAAIVVCGPAPTLQHDPALQAQELVTALLPDHRWEADGKWQIASPLPPLQSAEAAALEFVVPGDDEEWVEDDERTIIWAWTGAISRVRIYCYYDRCKLGGRSRGQAGFLVTEMIPNRGFASWTVPWMDAPGFWLRIAGYGEDGQRLAAAERYVRLRPKEAKNLHGTFILVVRRRQRLYYFRDDRLVRMHIVSTARAGYVTPRMAPGTVKWGVRMGQVFRKVRYAWSRAYNCPMPYWLAITSSGSHGIHATTPSAYRRLGRRASHGCIRQHAADARILFQLVDVGTAVYVF